MQKQWILYDHHRESILNKKAFQLDEYCPLLDCITQYLVYPRVGLLNPPPSDRQTWGGLSNHPLMHTPPLGGRPP